MPVQSRKNPNSKDKVYSDFRGGGLNLGASERFLSEKEVAGGKNFCYERNGGRFRTLEPLELAATAAGTVTSLYWSLNFGMIFSCGQALYRIVDGAPVSIGTLSGTDLPVYCDWGEEVERRLFVASGSIIQWYDGKQFVTQTPVPVDKTDPSGDDKWNTANDVMVREGRLLLSRTGRDRLRYSGIGDPENWQSEDEGSGDDIDVHTDADAQWLDVGYKEGGDIVRILPISRDLVIFRSDGSLYRLFSSFPDWTVIRVASQVEPVNRDAVAAVGNDIMFLDKDRGIRKVSAISDNDTDLAVTEKEGQKVNAWLAAHFTSDARLWTLPDRGEIWVKPNALNDVLCWNERYQGWTRIDLGSPITAACEADGVVYLALGAKIYRLTDSSVSPAIWPEMEIELAPVFGADRAMTDYQELCVTKDAAAVAELEIGRWRFAASGSKTVKHQIYVADELRPVLRSSGGTVVLDKLVMRTAEVV
ncbi:hypothetical protein [Cloacibacillus porcorum]|uniref:hypothetical protein n=1 Tax=Cloacibacillus porcorum TaxID=1197717 RepID=UPI003CFF85C8